MVPSGIADFWSTLNSNFNPFKTVALRLHKKNPNSKREQWLKGPWLFAVQRGIILPSYIGILTSRDKDLIVKQLLKIGMPAKAFGCHCSGVFFFTFRIF